MLVALAILCFAVVLYIDVYTDYKLIPLNKVKHGRGALLRTIGLLPCFCFLYFPLEASAVAFIFYKALIVSLMIAFWWWEFFDGFLNLKRGYYWRFNGSDDEDDAHTDNFLQGLSPVTQAILKWSLIAIFTTLYIIIKTKY